MPTYGNEFQSQVTAFARELIRVQLNKCLPKEIELFNTLHGSIDTIPFKKMKHAYHQTRASVVRHEREEKA